MNLKEDGVIFISDNKTCTVHGADTVKLKMFNNCEFLLFNVRYVRELRRNSLSVNIFDDLSYCIKVNM